MSEYKSFVSFAKRLKNKTRDPEPDLELEEEIDYEELIQQEKNKVALLEGQIQELRDKQSQLEAKVEKERH